MMETQVSQYYYILLTFVFLCFSVWAFYRYQPTSSESETKGWPFAVYRNRMEAVETENARLRVRVEKLEEGRRRRARRLRFCFRERLARFLRRVYATLLGVGLLLLAALAGACLVWFGVRWLREQSPPEPPVTVRSGLSPSLAGWAQPTTIFCPRAQYVCPCRCCR